MKRQMLILAALFLLTGCTGEDDAAQSILSRYESMENCCMEAVVICEFPQERREYTLQCRCDGEGNATVNVLEPTALQGISVCSKEGERCVLYEDVVLDAGTFGESRLSPVEILPRSVAAIKNGWLLEENAEQEDGKPLRRMVFETEENGVKQYWTLLFDEATGVPLRGEVSEGEELFFRIEFTDFSFGAIMTEEETVEQTESIK